MVGTLSGLTIIKLLFGVYTILAKMWVNWTEINHKLFLSLKIKIIVSGNKVLTVTVSEAF